MTCCIHRYSHPVNTSHSNTPDPSFLLYTAVHTDMSTLATSHMGAGQNVVVNPLHPVPVHLHNDDTSPSVLTPGHCRQCAHKPDPSKHLTPLNPALSPPALVLTLIHWLALWTMYSSTPSLGMTRSSLPSLSPSNSPLVNQYTSVHTSNDS